MWKNILSAVITRYKSSSTVSWFPYLKLTNFEIFIHLKDSIGYDLRRDMNVSWAENGQYATDVFTREAVRLISTHDTSQPLYLHVAHLAVHSGRKTQLLVVPNVEEALEKFNYIPDTQRRIFSGT
jgi:hypothetical protein